MATLRGVDGVAPRALEFLILTATRFGETRGAEWSEIQGDVWIIPAGRTKAHREHRVPLCERALKILDELRSVQTSELIFPGQKGQLNNRIFLDLIKRLGHKGVTATDFKARLGTGSRDDLFEKRLRLMDAWAEFCGSSPVVGKVISLRA